MDNFLSVYGSTRWLDAEQILLALLVPFLLSTVIATVYRWTFQSVSYSRSFIHTMVLSSMIVSPGHAKRIWRALGENLARFESQFGPIKEGPDQGPNTNIGFVQ